MNETPTSFQSKKLEDIIASMNLMSPQDLAALVNECQLRRRSLLDLLLEKKLLDETSIFKALSVQSNLEFFDLRQFEIPKQLHGILPLNLIKMQSLVPIAKEANVLTIATSDPSSFFSVQSIRIITGLNVKLVVSQKSEISRLKNRILEAATTTPQKSGMEGLMTRVPAAQKASASIPDTDKKLQTKSININEIIDELNLEFVTGSPQDQHTDLEDLLAESKQRPVISFVNKTLLEAVRKQASDIHVERMENLCRVRFRIDGELYDQYNVEKEAHDPILSRIKVISNLDITEKTLPQDGSFKLRIEGAYVDFRVSLFPSVYGQNAVIRILNRRVVPLDINKLGFNPKYVDFYKKKIVKPYGMILVTGPTGSGKTTTLYSSLLQINDGKKKIITVEDPVEFQLEGIHQTQVYINKIDPTKSMTFAMGLRSILRQDPDVIMIGEIRDPESATIAVNASMTGHLVFSTVHANHAVEVISRIKSLGVDVNLFMDCVNVIIAQRLVRKICNNCRVIVENVEKEFAALGMQPIDLGQAKIFKGTGCEVCSYSGYMGRAGIFEYFDLTEEVKENISDTQSIFKIKKLAREQGMMTLREACIEKVMAGETTIEELKNVSMED